MRRLTFGSKSPRPSHGGAVRDRGGSGKRRAHDSQGDAEALDLALFVREFKNEAQGAFLPLWMQRIALAPLVWVARKRGYGARYAPAPATA
jgi:hypothetical protein